MAKILVVDDDPSIRQLLTDVLEIGGHEVHVAVDGHDGIRLVEVLRPEFVVLDVMMPGIDGYGVLRCIRERDGDPIPVLMLTAAADAESTANGWSNGADFFLGKPFAGDEVLDLVDEAVGSHALRH